MPVTAFVNRLFVGDEAFDPVWLTAILLLALAAPVFAESMIFLKNPRFFVWGVDKPPKIPEESTYPVALVHPACEVAPCLESWLE
jgi:hypothetical protein